MRFLANAIADERTLPARVFISSERPAWPLFLCPVPPSHGVVAVRAWICGMENLCLPQANKSTLSFSLVD